MTYFIKYNKISIMMFLIWINSARIIKQDCFVLSYSYQFAEMVANLAWRKMLVFLYQVVAVRVENRSLFITDVNDGHDFSRAMNMTMNVSEDYEGKGFGSPNNFVTPEVLVCNLSGYCRGLRRIKLPIFDVKNNGGVEVLSLQINLVLYNWVAAVCYKKMVEKNVIKLVVFLLSNEMYQEADQMVFPEAEAAMDAAFLVDITNQVRITKSNQLIKSFDFHSIFIFEFTFICSPISLTFIVLCFRKLVDTWNLFSHFILLLLFASFLFLSYITFWNFSMLVIMKLLSWNVQGIGPPITQNHLSHLISKQNPDMIFLSETKANLKVMEKTARKFKFHDWFLVPKIGQSGGFIMAWHSNVSVSCIYFHNNIYMVDVLDNYNNSWKLICMYGAHSAQQKIEQWDWICDFSHQNSHPWMIIGDLNFILHIQDKQGGNSETSAAVKYIHDSINRLGLIDLRYIGIPFTWSNNREGLENIKERIGRVLASTSWTDIFPNAIVKHLVRVGSDHTHILLIPKPVNSVSRKPFKLLRTWLDHEGFLSLVRDNWNDASPGSSALRLETNLDSLSDVLKDWNKKVFGNIFSNIEMLNRKIEKLHKKNPLPIKEIKETQSQLDTWYKREKDYWNLLSKDKFLKEYDLNTAYFHQCASNRRRINHIHTLRDKTGLWIEDKDHLNNLLMSHFIEIGKSGGSFHDDILCDIIKPCITNEDNYNLMKIPDLEEIRKTLKSMNQWGSPGPDGYPPGFFSHNWETVGQDLVNSVQEFFRSKQILKSLNYTFITLIPKVQNPTSPSDFRPISLSNTTYKLISKILANRMKPFIDRIVSRNQSAFISGRQITDNIIIAHELLHTMKTSKNKNGFLALKIDLSKAFDRVEWSFIEKILFCLGFCEDWCQLIMQCITTTSFSVLLNGSPGDQFEVERGLRQGDPLSPYIFILVMEILSRLMFKAEKNGQISVNKVSREAPAISHLFFADDCFLFTKANIREAKNLMDTLIIFGEMSGQVVNLQKSGVYFSPKLHNRHCKIIARVLKVKRISKNDRYLGTPLFFDKKRTNNFEPLLDRYYKSLQGWKNKLLAQAGRTVLISSSSSSYPTYQMQCLAFPKETLSKIHNLQRDFWWSKKDPKHCIFTKSWDSICISKENGGLGIRSPHKHNISLLTRLAWRMLTSPDQLWVIILRCKYFKNNNPLKKSRKYNKSWIWASILKGLKVIKKNHVWQVNNGSSIDIWEDFWLPDQESPLFPLVIDESTPMKVNQLMNDKGEWNLETIHKYIDQESHNKILAITTNSNDEDRIRWLSTPSGECTTKSAYKFLINFSPNQANNRMWVKLWKLKVIPRIKMFCWKLLSRVLPLGKRIYKINKNSYPCCRLCNSDIMEDELHLFVNCNFAKTIWFAFSLQMNNLDNCTDIRSWFSGWLFDNRLYDYHKKIAFILWAIWKYRNATIHRNIMPSPSDLISQINRDYESSSLCESDSSVMQNVSKQVQTVERHDFEWIMMFDAAFEKSNFSMGFAITLSDNTGCRRECRIGSGRASCPLDAEAKAFLEVQNWIKERNLSDVIIFNDCKNLVYYVNDLPIPSSSLNWRACGNLKNAGVQFKSLSNVYFHFKNRVCLKLVDRLAKEARSKCVCNFSTESLSESVKCQFFVRAEAGAKLFGHNCILLA